ncbi:hypothetical protein SLEP1_g16301 [Rubroshorea leprosula]|uniref:Uncharacterized protein n=1 Tax=Rubroshorea leprosula TaxID=152421 RepID=A0AAV5IW88_9ROSI|nr:hypothetical protein SLEP1_g16301 [Rubroshorea leprosula]
MWMGGFVRKNMESSVALGSIFSRYMSRSRAVNVRKINPKVPIEEAKSIAHSLYDIIRQHGPLSISNTWIQAKVLSFSLLNFFVSFSPLSLMHHFNGISKAWTFL